MGNNKYLIPANSKKSMLIFGFFTLVDLIVLGVGVGLTFLLILLLDASTISMSLVIAFPAILSAFLIMPIPYYHNILTFITNMYLYLINRRKYYWRGWNYKDEF